MYFFCTHLNILIIIIISFILNLLLKNQIAQYFNIILYTYLNSITFQMTYQSFKNLYKLEITENWVSISEWICNILVITILPASIFHINYQLNDVLNQLSLMIITSDTIQKAQKFSRYSFLHIKNPLEKKKLFLLLFYNQSFIIKQYLSAIIITLLPVYAKLSLLILFDLLILLYLISLRPYLYSSINYFNFAIQIGYLVFEILLISSQIYFDHDCIKSWNNISNGLVICLVLIVFLIIFERIALLWSISLRKYREKQTIKIEKEANEITQKIQFRLQEEVAKLKPKEDISQIAYDDQESKNDTIREIVQQTYVTQEQKHDPYKKYNVIPGTVSSLCHNNGNYFSGMNNLSGRNYYSGLNNILGSILEQKETVDKFTEGRKEAINRIQKSIECDKITDEDFKDLQSHFGYNLEYNKLKEMKKEDFLRIILYDKKLQDDLITCIIQNDDSMRVDSVKLIYWGFRDQISNYLTMGQLDKCIALIP